MDMELDEIIAVLGLRPLPGEGGLYAETYRSAGGFAAGVLPAPFDAGPHVYGTAIYYLLTAEADSFSALHRLRGDEIYHFYLGDPVDMLLLHADGSSQALTLGQDLRAGQRVQAVISGGVWQGSRLRPGGRYALLGTTMAPGFEPREYEQGLRAELTRQYPREAERIASLTRGVS